MKVLSILQPWASLCVTIDTKTGKALKQIETRSWNTNYRGELLIHASKRMTEAQKRICYKPYFIDFFDGIDEDLTTGSIIGKVNLVHVIKLETVIVGHHFSYGSSKKWNFTEQELAFGDYSPGRYGWLLSNPVLFDTPIPVKGKLGIWEFNGDLP